MKVDLLLKWTKVLGKICPGGGRQARDLLERTVRGYRPVLRENGDTIFQRTNDIARSPETLFSYDRNEIGNSALSFVSYALDEIHIDLSQLKQRSDWVGRSASLDPQPLLCVAEMSLLSIYAAMVELDEHRVYQPSLHPEDPENRYTPGKKISFPLKWSEYSSLGAN